MPKKMAAPSFLARAWICGNVSCFHVRTFSGSRS